MKLNHATVCDAVTDLLANGATLTLTMEEGSVVVRDDDGHILGVSDAILDALADANDRLNDRRSASGRTALERGRPR